MIYLFEHPKTGELKDVFFHMDDEKKYVDDEGVAWQRRWTPPQISTNTRIDPYSQQQFLDKTRKAGTVGELWDRSAELSAMRAEKDGKDFVKEKFEDKEAKVRSGKRAAKKLKDLEVKVKIK